MVALKDNQILKFHRARELCYDLTKLRTGSVRDQLLRAVTLTRSLIEISKEICEGDLPDVSPRELLVLGGGVAGVACALVAARKGVRVTLLESHPSQLFATLHRSSRRVAPFEYDWPRSSDPTSIFSARERSLLLRYRSGNARWVCAVWQARMALWLARSKHANNLNIIYNADALLHYTIDPADAIKRTILAKGHFPGGLVEKEFGAVIDCTGHVRERTFIEKAEKHGGPPPDVFCGPRFWQDRDFLNHRLKFFVPIGANPVTAILVSGGGDGAMQDLQRIVTGRFGDKLYQKFIFHLGLGDLREHFYELAEADDSAKRAYAWKLSDGELEEMKRCDETFASVAKQVLAKYAAKNGPSVVPNWARKLASQVFKPMMFGGNTPKIVWAVEQSSCSYAYGLNRFLAHLTVQLLKELMGEEVLRFNTKIDKIVSATSAHQCQSDPMKCFGHTHKVSFEASTQPEEFDIIVIRHGLIFPEKAVFGKKAPIPEQLVPYDMPR